MVARIESLSKVMEVHFTEGSVIYKVHIKFFLPISLDIGLPLNKETEEQIGHIQRNFFTLQCSQIGMISCLKSQIKFWMQRTHPELYFTRIVHRVKLQS